MTYMDRQDVLNRVHAHLMAQGVPCGRMEEANNFEGETHSMFKCRYRGDAYDMPGLKCAIGALITDEHYYPDMDIEAMPVVAVLDEVYASLGVEHERQGDRFFLEALQRVHDKFPPAEWLDRLAAVAAKWELTAPGAA